MQAVHTGEGGAMLSVSLAGALTCHSFSVARWQSILPFFLFIGVAGLW